MSESEKEMWPTDLEWNFIDAERDNPTDNGFYDAKFGPIYLHVICVRGSDGTRFRAAVADDTETEIVDPVGTLYDQLDDAKERACELALEVLNDGAKQLMRFIGGLARLTGTDRQAGKHANFGTGRIPELSGPGRLLGLSESVMPALLDKIDPVDIGTCVVIQNILRCVDRDVPIDVIEKWTYAEREAAMAWAGACHLNASDNDDVVVPPEPEHVKGAKRVSLDWP